MRRAAVFIDKDGTLVHDVPHNVDPQRIRLTHGAAEALAALCAAGYALVVVTNQPGIAQGQFTSDALDGVRARLDQLLGVSGVSLAGFYFCPHEENEWMPCTCRKPQPGLIVRAAAELELDVARSWMLGDILHDVEAGRRAGCRAALVHCGHEDQWELTPWRIPDVIVPDLPAAARFILAQTDRGQRAQVSA